MHKSLLQGKIEKQLEDLSAQLQIKKLVTSDQQSLYKKFADIKLENVSVIVCIVMCCIAMYICISQGSIK